MARRKTSAKTKLIGWGVLALGVVIVIGIFLVSRGTAPPAPGAVVASTTQASSASAAAQPIADTPSASSGAASSNAAAATSSQASSAPSASSSEPASSSSALVVVEPDSMDQASRRNLVTALISQGVFTGVEAIGSPPKVGVTPLFQGLSPDLQRQFIATVYAYVNNGAAGKEPLQVIDATTGKVIGSYTAADGLKLG